MDDNQQDDLTADPNYDPKSKDMVVNSTQNDDSTVHQNVSTAYPNYDPKVKDLKLTTGEWIIVAIGGLLVFFIMVIVHHPELYRESASFIPDPKLQNFAIENMQNYLAPGWAEKWATEAYSKQNMDRSIGTYNVDHHGLTLSSIGIGTFMGDANADIDASLKAAVYDGVMKGVNVIDTAINYRGMRSEKCIGIALKRLLSSGSIIRESLFISSKGGYIPGDSDQGSSAIKTASEWAALTTVNGGIFPHNEIIGGIHCINPICLNISIAISRQNLGIQTIDLYYLNNAAEKQLGTITQQEFKNRLKESFSFLETQRKLNFIRFYGMASETSFTSDPNNILHIKLSDIIEIAKSVGGENHGFRYVQIPVSATIPYAAMIPQYNGNNINGNKGIENGNGNKFNGNENGNSFLQLAGLFNISVMSCTSIGGGDYKSLQIAETLYHSCIHKDSIWALELNNKMIDITTKHNGKMKGSNKKSLHLSPAGKSLLITRSTYGITTALVGMKQINHVNENVNILNLPLIPPEIISNCIYAKRKEGSLENSAFNVHPGNIPTVEKNVPLGHHAGNNKRTGRKKSNVRGENSSFK